MEADIFVCVYSTAFKNFYAIIIYFNNLNYFILIIEFIHMCVLTCQLLKNRSFLDFEQKTMML